MSPFAGDASDVIERFLDVLEFVVARQENKPFVIIWNIDSASYSWKA